MVGCYNPYFIGVAFINMLENPDLADETHKIRDNQPGGHNYPNMIKGLVYTENRKINSGAF